MTRINVIEPERLTDQHLIAEYRELPRVFPLAAAWWDRGGDTEIPDTYRLGKGHVTFFYMRLPYLRRRHVAIIRECWARGFDVKNDQPLLLPRDAAVYCVEPWRPTPADRAVNLARLRDKLATRPGFYRHRGVVVAPDFYDFD